MAVLCFAAAGPVRWPETAVMLVAAVIGGDVASDYFAAYLAKFKDHRYIKGVRHFYARGSADDRGFWEDEAQLSPVNHRDFNRAAADQHRIAKDGRGRALVVERAKGKLDVG